MAVVEQDYLFSTPKRGSQHPFTTTSHQYTTLLNIPNTQSDFLTPWSARWNGPSSRGGVSRPRPARLYGPSSQGETWLYPWEPWELSGVCQNPKPNRKPVCFACKVECLTPRPALSWAVLSGRDVVVPLELWEPLGALGRVPHP
ncbi:hypothetical protein RRG08_003435 [Elysia crispata]|uniref:Uncharacterized protein n=1 Tax=Elysia crispata TaxID=231223 RepID=A0AAE1ABP0_9GAST|nr:hypothetical protein RRG08_003435 [Elysia crispata]